MKKKLFYLILILLLITGVLFSAFNSDYIDPRGAAGGGLMVADYNGAVGLFYNPASIRIKRVTEIYLYYNYLYQISELKNYSLFGTYSFKSSSAIGLGYSYVGSEFYSEKFVIVGYGYSFIDRLFVGLNLKYFSINVDGFGTTYGIGMDPGIIVKILRDLTIGASTTGLAGWWKNYDYNTFIKLKIIFGLKWQPLEFFKIAPLMIFQENNIQKYKIGTEISPLPFAIFRSAVEFEPTAVSFGISLYKRIKQNLELGCDYTFYMSSELPVSHYIGVYWRL